MSDPERLLHGASGNLAARLVRAGASEAPSRRRVERALSAVAAGTSTLGAAGTAGALGVGGAKAGSAALGFVVLAKWASVGMAGGALVSLAAHGLAGRAPVRTAPKPEAAHVAVAGVTPVVSSSARAVERAPGASENTPPRPVPAVASARVEAASTLEEARAPLAAEVAFVDRGRTLFRNGTPSAALAALASYESEFPARRLLPEVLLLRMDALAATGQRGAAEALAHVLVRDFGRSPHAARARAVLAGR